MPGRRLTLVEREEISRGCRFGASCATVARRLGRPTSTVSREVQRHGGPEAYRAWFAQLRAQQMCRRPKALKLVASPQLAQVVAARLGERWSPEQIARRLRREHAEDPSWWVSHETIYRSLYLQGRGGLRKELHTALRTGRAKRRPKVARSKQMGRPKGMVLISERPAEIEDRAVPGHWEGDLLSGMDNKSQIAPLVERTSRFVLLVHLPHRRTAEAVRDAIADKIQRLPEALRRSLTWDQGSEMAQHVALRVDTGVEIYFCDPHSPWQRGTAENTNGLLRQYFPKGTDLSVFTEEDLDAVATELNGRPRKTLDWMTPSEKFAELVAMTG